MIFVVPDEYEKMIDIKGYEGRYQVSEDGYIWSVQNYKKLKPSGSKNLIGLCKDGKAETVILHRVVANAFLPNPSRYVKFKVGSTDCSASNLFWSYDRDISRVLKCRGDEVIAEYFTIEEAAKATEAPPELLRRCIKLGMKCYGYEWRVT